MELASLEMRLQYESQAEDVEHVELVDDLLERFHVCHHEFMTHSWGNVVDITIQGQPRPRITAGLAWMRNAR
jgi:hypothetical protein